MAKPERVTERRDVPISATFVVSRQFLSDILVGMAETCLEMVSWFGDADTDIMRIEDDPQDTTWLEPLSVIRIVGTYDREQDNEGDRGGKATLDMAAIAVGLQRVITYSDLNAELKGRILVAMCENDTGHIDSEACDVIAQLAIFGKVIYG